MFGKEKAGGSLGIYIHIPFCRRNVTTVTSIPWRGRKGGWTATSGPCWLI